MRWVSVEFQLTFNCWISVELQLHNAGWSVTGEFQLAFNCWISVELQLYVCKWISYWWILTRFQLLNFSWVSTMCASGSVTLLVNFNSLSTVESLSTMCANGSVEKFTCKWVEFQLVNFNSLSTVELQLSFNYISKWISWKIHMQMSWVSTGEFQLAFNCWISVEFQLAIISYRWTIQYQIYIWYTLVCRHSAYWPTKDHTNDCKNKSLFFIHFLVFICTTNSIQRRWCPSCLIKRSPASSQCVLRSTFVIGHDESVSKVHFVIMELWVSC